MKSEKLAFSVQKLQKAIQRLQEALAQGSENVLLIDGCIQRFEFVFEQCWKTLQKALETEGIRTGTPRETLQKAFQAGWIGDENLCLQMLQYRNDTSHTYNEDIAQKIYGHIPSYLPILEKCLKKLLEEK